MPRRRVASPKPSAPVRSAGRQPNATTQSPSAYAAASPQPTRTAIPATVPPATPTSNGPGLFGQMAATAGGVAIGSAVVKFLNCFVFLIVPLLFKNHFLIFSYVYVLNKFGLCGYLKHFSEIFILHFLMFFLQFFSPIESVSSVKCSVN